VEAHSKRLWIVTLSNVAVTILFIVVIYGAVFVRVLLAGRPTFILLLIGLALSVTGLRFTKRVVSRTPRRVAFVVNGCALALDSLIILGLGTVFAEAPIERFLSSLRSPADRAIQEDDIRESVFRYRMGYPKRNCPFFLSIDGKDPSDAFMRRFAALGRTVKKESESYFKKDQSNRWLRDRSTGEEGVAFSVGPISWLSSDRVEVSGGMYCGILCADGGVYRLKKKEGHWVVDEYKEQWVS
jgi:hypothetical protein